MSNDKIHQRVADILGMELADEDDSQIDFDPDDVVEPLPVVDMAALVPLPTDVAEIDNPELPALHNEMVRIEHGQQQTEILLNRGIATVQQALGEIALVPYAYKARAMESAAELFKAVADLGKHKIEVQIKLAELKMKQAAFTRNKSTQGSPLGTGNTFVINREDLMKSIQAVQNNAPQADNDQS